MTLKANFRTLAGYTCVEDVIFQTPPQRDGTIFVIGQTARAVPLRGQPKRKAFLIGMGSNALLDQKSTEYSAPFVVFPEDCKEVARQLRELADKFDDLGG